MKKIITSIFALLVTLTINAQCNENNHSNNPSDNWESCATKTSPNETRGTSHWLQYDLGYIYPITSSYIWNYNVSGETNKGFKDVVVDYSLDGTTWIELGNYTFTKASGSSVYPGFEGPDFGDVNARYILVTALNNYGDNCFGLAECKFNIGADVVIGIQEITDENALSIYPNPASKYIQISAEDIEINEVILRNSVGNELQRYGANYPKMMDVSYLPNGVYFIVANTTNNEFVVRKFVKVGK